MTSVSLEKVNENVQSLRKEVDELKEIMQMSNRAELAQKIRDARAGKGDWTPLKDV